MGKNSIVPVGTLERGEKGHGQDRCKAMACPRNLEEGRDGSETQRGLVGTTRSSIDPTMIQWDPVAGPE